MITKSSVSIFGNSNSTSIKWSRTSNILATVGDYGAITFLTDKLKFIDCVGSARQRVYAFDWHPERSTIAASSQVILDPPELLSNIHLYDLSAIARQNTKIHHVVGAYPHIVSFSPDGSFVAYCTSNSSLYLRPLNRLGEVTVFIMQRLPIVALFWSRDTHYIGALDENGGFCFWSVLDGRQIKELKALATANPTRNVFNPVKNLILEQDPDKDLVISDVDREQIEQTISCPDLIEVAWSDDGINVYGLDIAQRLFVWRLGDEELIQSTQHIENLQIKTFEQRPKSSDLVLWTTDRKLVLWNFMTSDFILLSDDVDLDRNGLTWNVDGTRLACLETNGIISIFYEEHNMWVRLSQGHGYPQVGLEAIAWNSSSDGVFQAYETGQITFTSILRENEDTSIIAQVEPIPNILSADHSNQLAVCTERGILSIIVHGHSARWITDSVAYLHWHPTKSDILLGTYCNPYSAFLVNIGKTSLERIETEGKLGVWSPSGKLLVSILYSFTEPPQLVVNMNPLSNKRVISRHIIYIEERRLLPISAIAVSSDDQFVCIGTNSGEIFVIALKDGSLVSSDKYHQSRISGLAWHPASNLIASGCHDGLLVINNPTTSERQNSHQLPSLITDIKWSSDGNMVAASCFSGMIFVRSVF